LILLGFALLSPTYTLQRRKKYSHILDLFDTNLAKINMKKFVLPFLLVAFAFSNQVSAANTPYSICSVAGYFDGNGDQFLHELALRVVEKNGFANDSVCSSEIKFGREVAVKLHTPGKVKTAAEATVIGHADHFRNLIYDAILSRVKFD
jgi:hypothetical protein